eukprot:135904-Rhodomonas_salina.1
MCGTERAYCAAGNAREHACVPAVGPPCAATRLLRDVRYWHSVDLQYRNSICCYGAPTGCAGLR